MEQDLEMQMHDQGDQEEANEGEGEMRTGADYKAMAMCKIIQTDEEGR